MNSPLCKMKGELLENQEIDLTENFSLSDQQKEDDIKPPKICEKKHIKNSTNIIIVTTTKTIN